MAQRGPISTLDALRASLLEDEDLRDLEQSLDAVEQAVKGVWRDNYQPWFTDHGPQHSKRTAQYALSLTDLPRLHPDLWLSPLETYILWVAAWLHDVGMQDLLAAGAPLGQIDADGYEAVRHQHPDRSSERILQQWGALGLPAADHVLAETVAAVARAHGTRFYKDTVATALAAEVTVRNRPVRSRLLAALLLFADELDLHYERAQPLAGWAVDNPISEAHKFKHDSVRSVRVLCAEDGTISVELHLSLHKDLSQEHRDAVRRWIEVKLRRQMSMIESEIEVGFLRQVTMNRLITFTVETRRAHSELPSAAVLAVISAETSRDELINHDSDYRAVAQAVAEHPIVVVSSPSGLTGNSHAAASDLLDAVCADASASGSTVCRSRRARLSLVATAADVIGEWGLALGVSEPSFELDEDVRRHSGLTAVVGALESSMTGDRVVLALDRADAVDEASMTWLIEVAFPTLASSAANTCVLMAAQGPTLSTAAGNNGAAIMMGNTEPEAAAAFLGRLVDRRTATAEAQALPDYSLLKKAAQAHELTLRGVG